jgi:hypothetical protein
MNYDQEIKNLEQFMAIVGIDEFEDKIYRVLPKNAKKLRKELKTTGWKLVLCGYLYQCNYRIKARTYIAKEKEPKPKVEKPKVKTDGLSDEFIRMLNALASMKESKMKFIYNIAEKRGYI